MTNYTIWLTEGCVINGHRLKKLAELDDVSQIDNIWSDFVRDNLKVRLRYYRTLLDRDNLTFWVDFGSYSKFVEISCLNEEAYTAYLQKGETLNV